MKKLSFLILISFCITSCEKVFEGLFSPEDRVIEGYFYKNCNQEPVANQLLIVKTTIPKGLTDEEKTLGYVTTDANGFIRFKHQEDNPNNNIEFWLNSRNKFFETTNEKKKSFIAVKKAYTRHNIILMNGEALSNQDTLFLAAQLHDTIFIKLGPFINGQTIPVDIVPNLGFSDFVNYELSRNASAYFFWGIGKKDFANRTESPYSDKKTLTDVKQAVCGIGGDVIIDLSIKR